MSYKKKDLEIVYSLRWKNGPKRDDKKQMSIVAVYDIPATTLNFEVFKSYLLKNSGTAEDDVSVYYIMDNGKEYPIQSQTDFQVALYAFRRKARAGEIINLQLESLSDQPVSHKNVRHSNDVETQIDNMEPQSIVSTCSNIDIPPEWFIAGLAQLKKDIKEEVTANVSTIVSNAIADLKCANTQLLHGHGGGHSSRLKSKVPSNRFRKVVPEHASDAKMLLKSLKLDTKLENLERKTAKYREKRQALQHHQKSSDNGPKSSDSEAGPSSGKSRSRDKEEKRKAEELKCKTEEQQPQKSSDEPLMDARPINVQTSVPHMLGGEIYLHQWEVQNIGQAQWTSVTQLQYTWGSKKLVPVEKNILVPYLKPGDIGTVSVRLQIPNQAGKYECYWQFTHKGRRFGHWLGVQVIVDAFDLKGHSSVLEMDLDRALDQDYERLFRNFSGSDSPKEPSETGRQRVIDLESLIKSMEEMAKTPEDGVQAAAKPDAVGRPMEKTSDPVRKRYVRLCTADGEMIAKLDRLCNEEDEEELSDSGKDDSWSSPSASFDLDFDSVDENGEPVEVPLPYCFVVNDRPGGGFSLKKEDDDTAIIAKEAISVDPNGSEESTDFGSKIDDKGEFVVVPVPQCFVLDTPENSDSNSTLQDKTPALRAEPAKAATLAATSSGGQTPSSSSKAPKAPGAGGSTASNNFDDNNNTESVSGASSTGSYKLRDEELDNIVVITVPKDQQVKEGFIYVHVDGQKVLIPKNILKAHVVNAAHELEKSPWQSAGVIIDSNESLNSSDKPSPTPSKASTITNQQVQPESKKHDDYSGNTLDAVPFKTLEEPIIPHQVPLESVAVDLSSTASREHLVEYPASEEGVDRSNYFEANNYMSHCSAAGSCYSEFNGSSERQNRLFVFPKDVPGYEFVYPTAELNDPILANIDHPERYDFIRVNQRIDPAAIVGVGAGAAYNIPQQMHQVPNVMPQMVPNGSPQMVPNVMPQMVPNVMPQMVPNPLVVEPVPNYQQTPPQMRKREVTIESDADKLMQELGLSLGCGTSRGTPPPPPPTAPAAEDHRDIEEPRRPATAPATPPAAAHPLSEAPGHGAAPQAPGRWVNGHWVSTNPETPREANLQALAEMGFWNRDLNATLLARFNDDLNRVVSELVQ